MTTGKIIVIVIIFLLASLPLGLFFKSPLVGMGVVLILLGQLLIGMLIVDGISAAILKLKK